MTTFPRKTYTDGDLGMSLQDAGLVPSAVLILTKIWIILLKHNTGMLSFGLHLCSLMKTGIILCILALQGSSIISDIFYRQRREMKYSLALWSSWNRMDWFSLYGPGNGDVLFYFHFVFLRPSYVVLMCRKLRWIKDNPFLNRFEMAVEFAKFPSPDSCIFPRCVDGLIACYASIRVCRGHV